MLFSNWCNIACGTLLGVPFETSLKTSQLTHSVLHIGHFSNKTKEWPKHKQRENEKQKEKSLALQG